MDKANGLPHVQTFRFEEPLERITLIPHRPTAVHSRLGQRSARRTMAHSRRPLPQLERLPVVPLHAGAVTVRLGEHVAATLVCVLSLVVYVVRDQSKVVGPGRA